jgi:hypothetical protein
MNKETGLPFLYLSVRSLELISLIHAARKKSEKLKINNSS